MAMKQVSKFLTLVAPLLLVGCAGGSVVPDREKPRAQGKTPNRTVSRPEPGAAIGAAPFSSVESRQCLSDLAAAGAKFTPLPNKYEAGGCSVIDSIRVLDFGMPTTNLAAMTCPLAKTFAGWTRYAVQPAAEIAFGQKLVKIETMGTYSCRNIYGGRSGRLSQHAFANAVDVSGFVLADGRRVTVLGDWNGDAQARHFFKLIHGSACKRFGTVLSPEYNAAHADHLHFDMSGKNFCR